jgi:hypothetical protein
MKIAVVGAGIFGVTIAYTLAKNHSVDLFEKNNDIMMESSDVNQCRIHRGYHYPRSIGTVKEVLIASRSFNDEFHDTIVTNTENYYCISKTDSITSSNQFKEFCKKYDLEYELITPTIINKNSIDLCFKVKENLFDHEKLKKLCWKKLNDTNVNIFLNTKASNKIFDNYDFIVICTYGQTENLFNSSINFKREYQFEICEKVFVTLPAEFNKKSLLIMDGPFMGIDPVGSTGMFIIGDVVNTVHQRNIGKKPEIDPKFLPLLNKGIISTPSISNYELFIESASKFMPEIKKAKYVGSSFCLKATLPNVDKTDERPTLIDQLDEKTINVFSGKISTCIETSKEIQNIIEKINI